MMSSTRKENELEDLKLFHRNFSASFSFGDNVVPKCSSRDRSSQPKSNSSSKCCPTSKKEIEKLKDFQKSFMLELNVTEVAGTKSNEHNRKVPSTLNIHQQNGERLTKKRRRRPPRPSEGVVDFASIYELTDEVLGEGAWSRVVVCKNRKSMKSYAVKIISKSHGDVRKRVLKEVEILHICASNRYFIQIEDLFETPNEFYLVSERMSGQLLELIERREHFTECEASKVTGEVACALEFLHSKGIAHRDLKPENILCQREDEVVPIKICDFDLSSVVPNQSTTSPSLYTPVGSAEFMAPEVVGAFQGDVFSYDKKCDLWSLGVVLYVMLSGSRPFYGRCGRPCGWEKGKECAECQEMLLQRITEGEFKFTPAEIWKDISSDAKDLVSKLLEKDALRRLSAEEVLSHSWLDKDVPSTELVTPTALRRNPSIHEELSFFTTSCMKCTRKMSTQRSITLSPPGSSNLACRRESKNCKEKA